MGLLNIFKQKTNKGKQRMEKKSKKAEKKTPAKKPASVQVEKETSDKSLAKEPAKKTAVKKQTGIAAKVLKSPRITEKATFLQNKNQYIFKVADNIAKSEIKKAIEEVYNVNVVKARTINAPRKRKRLGRTVGWAKGYKKAIVSVKKGQTIEVLPR